MSRSHAQQVQQSLDEGQSLRQRLRTAEWHDEDWGRVERVLAAFVEAPMTLKRLLTRVFGKRRRRRSTGADAVSRDEAEAAGDGGEEGEGDVGAAAGVDTAGAAVEEAPRDEGKPKGGHRAGTGRLGAAAYAGAERVACRYEARAVGQRCPVCGQGSLYRGPPGVESRLDGNALLRAIRYELEKLRCSACGQSFTATLPADAGQEKYRPRARAVLAVSRYLRGLPMYRMESYQAMQGVPLPDATQWEQIEQVATCAYVVFASLETRAAQGELISQDDTSVRMLSLIAEHLKLQAAAEARGLSQPTARTGMHTTALVVKVGERTIMLYDSGRSHAGDNLKALLEQRVAGREPPLVMADALASNTAHDVEVIQCPGLAHGRRKFSDLADVFPQEWTVVLEPLQQVYDHDEEARDQHMSPEARLAYHQDDSQPLMKGLKAWLQKQVDDRLVEPNSARGKAMSSLLGHWKTLTRFLPVAGAPLDTNLGERALKLFI
jgi:hypothetical protein